MSRNLLLPSPAWFFAVWLAVPVSACSSGGPGDARAVGAAPTLTPKARVDLVRGYRRSGNSSYWDAQRRPGRERRWTPEEVVDLLEEHPDYLIDMGIWSGRPPGHGDHREVGRVVNEAQAIARQRGVETGRLGFRFRLDVYAKYVQGHGSCKPNCGWGGTMTDPPFENDFVVRVPRSEHRWAIEHRWHGDWNKDPFSPLSAKHWPQWLDREAILALNTKDEVAQLYGAPFDADPAKLSEDWQFRVTSVVMDLRNPRYRAWSHARIIESLRVMGIDPGEAATIILAYKPGWHAYYAGGPQRNQNCFVEGGQAWTGPAGWCAGPRRWDGGPYHRTDYGPGEFEVALNASLRELRAALVAAGLPQVVMVTTERPAYANKAWSLLDQDVRDAPWLIGEVAGACARHDVKAIPDPVRCRRKGAKAGAAAAQPR